jgi:hypothetical protein
MILESQDGSITVIDVALLVEAGEPRCDFSQVALSDRLTAQRSERLRSGCTAIQHHEFHVPPPNEKQKPNDSIVSRTGVKIIAFPLSALARIMASVDLRFAVEPVS